MPKKTLKRQNSDIILTNQTPTKIKRQAEEIKIPEEAWEAREMISITKFGLAHVDLYRSPITDNNEYGRLSGDNLPLLLFALHNKCLEKTVVFIKTEYGYSGIQDNVTRRDDYNHAIRTIGKIIDATSEKPDIKSYDEVQRAFIYFTLSRFAQRAELAVAKHIKEMIVILSTLRTQESWKLNILEAVTAVVMNECDVDIKFDGRPTCRIEFPILQGLIEMFSPYKNTAEKIHKYRDTISLSSYYEDVALIEGQDQALKPTVTLSDKLQRAKDVMCQDVTKDAWRADSNTTGHKATITIPGSDNLEFIPHYCAKHKEEFHKPKSEEHVDCHHQIKCPCNPDDLIKDIPSSVVTEYAMEQINEDQAAELQVSK